MLSLLCVIWIFFAAFDASYTMSMLNRHGVEIEMNSAIRKLCLWWGISKGVIAGIFIPTLAMAGLCWMFHLQTAMLVLVILRFILLLSQIRYRLAH